MDTNDLKDYDSESENSDVEETLEEPKNNKKKKLKKEKKPVRKKPELLTPELKFGAWYVENKVMIIKALMILLVVVCVLLWGFVFYRAFDLYILRAGEVDRLKQQMEQTSKDIQATQDAYSTPDPVMVQEVKVFPAGDGKYDIMAVLQNANEIWKVKFFNYAFVVDGETLPMKRSFIMPGQTKYLVEFNYESESRINSADIQVSDFSWEKHIDYQEKYDEIMQIQVSDPEFVSSFRTELSDQEKVSRTTFQATNNSAYDFYDVGIYVVLFKGKTITGINYVRLPDFNSQETKDLDVTWFGNVAAPSSTQVSFDFDFLDPSNIKVVKSNSGQVK